MRLCSTYVSYTRNNNLLRHQCVCVCVSVCAKRNQINAFTTTFYSLFITLFIIHSINMK